MEPMRNIWDEIAPKHGWSLGDEAILDKQLEWPPKKNDLTVIIPDKLWQGAFVVDWKDIEHLGIKTVVNVSEIAHRDRSAFAGRIVNWQIEDDDLPDLFILNHVTDLVAQNVQHGISTLVHCAAGLNRSGLVNALAIMKLTGWNGAKAVKLLREARDTMVLCNEKFERYVREYRVRLPDGVV